MAVERGLGSGGLPEELMIPEEEMLQNVVDLPLHPELPSLMMAARLLENTMRAKSLFLKCLLMAI